MSERESSAPSCQIKTITPSESALNPRPRGIYAAADGEITIVNKDGVSAPSIPVFAGQVLPVQPYKVTAATVTIYGLYG